MPLVRRMPRYAAKQMGSRDRSTVHEDQHCRCAWMGEGETGVRITPLRPLRSIADTTSEERLALLDAVTIAVRALRERLAGCEVTVDWLERAREGDGDPLQIAVVARSSGTGALVQGDTDDPLLARLAPSLATARQVDVAVAFAMERGVVLLRPYLQDCLARGGRLRFLTGDYRCVTEPDALIRLLDLEGDVSLRVFETKDRQSFHPKAWILRGDAGDLAFVGSSNLSATALTDGIEWNYRVVDARDREGFAAVSQGFERLFAHRRTRALTGGWIDAYRARFANRVAEPREVPSEALAPAQPTPVQGEALAKLAAWREAGNRAGLVVLATGLGKTWLAAFDSRRFARVLFVAHREEILAQAREVFRRVRPSARLGSFTGKAKDFEADVLFASIQSLGRPGHLARFSRDHFDYLVVDEFHHAAAATYRRLIEHFAPRFLLGLTATPERGDGADLLALCGFGVVYRCELGEAVRQGWLCPIRYHGVADDVDYTQIPWRNGRFDPTALDAAIATTRRAELAMRHLERFGGVRTLAFCASTRHADFMADWFRTHGKRAVAVHTEATSAPRTTSLGDLRDGKLDVICCVDMFNEGVDVPAIDTVLMLRPTESRVVWLQQLGRGLRKADGKPHLSVIDTIGNHRSFLDKPRLLLRELCGVGEDREALRQTLRALSSGALELPPGCSVDYELAAIDILDRLLAPRSAEATLRDAYLEFEERHDRRPSASELFADGSLDRAVLHRLGGSWFGFVAAMGGLDSVDAELAREHAAWFAELESTPMQRSYQMLVLQSLIELEAIPGEAALERIVERVAAIAERSDELRREVAASTRRRALRTVLLDSPILALTNQKRGVGSPFFAPSQDPLVCTIRVAPERRGAFVAMTRELVEWRLAEYLGGSRA
jgi:superfamily II DNA or RNA helicase/HKD family nuclease